MVNDIDNNMDFVSIFENKLASYTGFKYAITVDCCTNGILLACELLNRFGLIYKRCGLRFSQWTYMSVPMTLFNNGWNVTLTNDKWIKFYEIGNTKVFDSATDFHANMHDDYCAFDRCMVCISFQQKKRLSLGRGGAILTDNYSFSEILKRLRYDGRNPYMSDRQEIDNFSNQMTRGYHCYMEPDKAAKGILLLNQSDSMLKPYQIHSWNEYSNLTKLNHLWNQNEQH